MSNFLETYVIHVTKKCNMKCLYCYETNKNSEYDLESLLILSYKIAENAKDQKYNIEFLGGEPMLAIDKIEEIINFFNTKYNNVNEFIITTNGTILNDKLFQLMNQNKNLIFAISIDGTKLMNQLRITKDEQNSFDIVVKNIKTLLSTISDASERVTIHMVMHPYNIAYLNDGIEYFYNLGIRCFGLGIVESTIMIGKEFAQRYILEMCNLSIDIINGKYPNIYISELEALKPKEDIRTYLKDENNIIVAESYGRIEYDITKTKDYKIEQPSSNIEDFIYSIREVVYNQYQYLKGINK